MKPSARKNQREFWTDFELTFSQGHLCPHKGTQRAEGRALACVQRKIKPGVGRRESENWTAHWAAAAKGLLPRRWICTLHAPYTGSLLAQRQGHNVPSTFVRKQNTQVNSSSLSLQTCLGWLLLFSRRRSGSARGKVTKPLPKGEKHLLNVK